MPIDPIKIPQNVYIEDRVVGPLTLKQIITVAIGCGFSYALYSVLLKSYGAVPLPVTIMAWVPGALSFMFAFVKINDLSMFRLCLLALERVNKPSTRTWTPRRGLEINIHVTTAPAKDAKEASTAANHKETHTIDEITTVLDSQKSEEEPAPATLTDDEDDSAILPVNRARISANPLSDTASTDTIAVPPQNATSSIFRDLSPHA